MNAWLEKHISLVSYRDPYDEKLNADSHFFGALLAVAGLFLILGMTDMYSSAATECGMIIFALSNILLYTASGFYHKLEPGNAKRICRILDHMNIYILIAGSYTPILLYVNTPKMYAILALQWGIVIAGTVLTVCYWGKMKVAHVVLYIVMGWTCVFFYGDIFPNIPQGLIKWMFAGGVIYTLGVIFYGVKTIPHHHFIWHIFVLSGSLAFYIGYIMYLR